MEAKTTLKHRTFVGEPMGEKPVTVLPGVDVVLGTRLKNAGFTKAYMVLGKYLILGRNKELFENWMYDTIQANAKQRSDCYKGLNDWYNQHG